MAHKPVLRGEVGARAFARAVSVEGGGIGELASLLRCSPAGILAHADPSWALEFLRPRFVHGGRMKCRALRKHHGLFQAHTGVKRCLAQPLRGSTTTKKASGPVSTTRPNRFHTHTHSP